MQNIFFSRFIACFFVGFFLNNQAIASLIKWNSPNLGYFGVSSEERIEELKLDALQDNVLSDEGTLTTLDNRQKALQLKAQKLKLRLTNRRAKNKRKLQSVNRAINKLQVNSQSSSTEFNQLKSDNVTLKLSLKLLKQKNASLEKMAKASSKKLQREIDQNKFYKEKLALVERRSVEFFKNQKKDLPARQQAGLTNQEKFSLGNQEQFNLANRYRKNKEYKKALNLYLQLSEKGYARAQLNTGHMYYSGFGTKKDLNVALAFYLQAGMQGIAEAQYLVGYLLDKNQKHSLFWYKQAAKQGNKAAQKVLWKLKQK